MAGFSRGRGRWPHCSSLARAIIAIGIAGSQSILPPGSFRFRRGHVTIRIGKPFTLDDLYGQTGWPAVIEATRRVMAEIASLLPPEHQPADGIPRTISVA